MLADSCLHFLGYKITNLSFNITDDFAKKSEFKISPSFGMSIQHSDDDNYQVKLTLKIKGTESEPQPFNLYVEMVGDFSFQSGTEDEDLKQTIIRENTAAIMFPFLRAAISSITSATNIPVLTLPIINIAETLKQCITDV